MTAMQGDVACRIEQLAGVLANKALELLGRGARTVRQTPISDCADTMRCCSIRRVGQHQTIRCSQAEGRAAVRALKTMPITIRSKDPVAYAS